MAERRCLARSVVTGDAYLGLSHAARTLYVHLLVIADDDGFTDGVLSAQRLTETGANELEELKNAGFVIIFPSGVAAVRHFWVHNTKRSDRYKPTLHTCEKTQVNKSDNGIYEFAGVNQLATNRQPTVTAKERKERKENKENIFTPPTASEVEAYARETGKEIDGKDFVNYYQSKGWMVGLTQMKDWKAAVDRWKPLAEKKITTAQDYEQRNYTEDQLDNGSTNDLFAQVRAARETA